MSLQRTAEPGTRGLLGRRIRVPWVRFNGHLNKCWEGVVIAENDRTTEIRSDNGIPIILKKPFSYEEIGDNHEDPT